MIHKRTLEALEFGKIKDYFTSLCVSEAGKDQARKLEPLPSAQDAMDSFSLYNQALVWMAEPGPKKYQLSSFPDTRPLLREAAKRVGSTRPFQPDLESFWALRESLREAKKASESITAGGAAEKWPDLLALAQSSPLPERLLAALNRCISDDGLLKDQSSPELFRLRNEIRSLHQSCLRKVKDFAQQYNMLPYLQDEFMTLSSDRYVLPLKANFKGRMQGIIHDWSQTGETCYFEPLFLVEVNNRLQELKHEEREEERKILEYLSGLLESDLEGAQAALDLLASLDVLNAKALLADKLAGTCPAFTEDNEGIELLEARHPLLLLSRLNSGERPPRPLDIVLRPGERALIITGGNAGGKTVCLKTLGLVSAMAMSGLPVPVSPGSHLPWFERVDAFIGDEQSLDANVSTFTAQIDHLAKAWKHLDNRGLVLLDEFGAGTDPAEGAALAQAVMDSLLEKESFVLSATHFPALKSYALVKDGVRAASMLFNPENNKPLFKLAYDQVGSSQALTVAKDHGLPEVILEKARRYLLQDGQDSGAILARLNELAVQRETEAQSLRKQEEKARQTLKEKAEKLDRERARLQEDVRDKIKTLMKAWKDGRADAKKTAREMSGIREELGLEKPRQSESLLPPLTEAAVGRPVFHSLFNKRGIIREIDSRKKRARIDLDGVSLWADLADLREPGEAAPKKASPSVKKPSPGAALSLDVRGKRADEALAEVERFIDQAILAGFSELEIVHGRGTGALRREIHEYLKSSPATARFSAAPEDRGGDGMTIVELA